jgi:hypothetical protein
MLSWLRWFRKQETELQSALDRLIEAGLLFRQGFTTARDLFVQARAGARTWHTAACCAALASNYISKSLKSSKPMLPT